SRQLSGFVRFEGIDAHGRHLSAHVVGRDDVETQHIRRWWHRLWYKDAPPALRRTIEGEVEKLAYTLLVAERAGAHVSEFVAAGEVEAERLALLATTRPEGAYLEDLTADQVGDDVLDDAWTNLQSLRRAGVAHGSPNGHHLLVAADGSTMLHELTAP